MWAKLLRLATSGGTGAGTGAEVVAPTTATAGGDNNQNGVFLCSPGKSVTFNGGDGGNGGTAVYLRSDDRNAFEGFSRDSNSAFDALSAATPSPQTADDSRSDGGSGHRSSVIFARLWAECVGDDTCAAFATDDGSTLGGADGKSCAPSPETPSPRQQHASPSLLHHRHLEPWERLVAVLRDERGVDVARALTTHEQILLEREVTDWLQRAQGRKERELGRGKGMAERLASAAAAVLCQEEIVPTTDPERPYERRAGEVSHGSGEIPNSSRRRLSVGGFEFPAVVVEGPSSPVGGSPETNTERAGGRNPSATAGDAGDMGHGTATSGSKKKSERQLDLQEVAFDAHEVCVFVHEVIVAHCRLASLLLHPGVVFYASDADGLKRPYH